MAVGVISLYENIAGVSKNNHAASNPVGGGSTKARVYCQSVRYLFFSWQVQPAPQLYT